MKQVLSVEQMKHLQELGVNTSDASMVLIATDDDGCMLLWEDAEKAIKNHLYDVYFNLYYVESSSYDHSCKKECGVFTLQDISDEDCLKEGIYEDSGDDKYPPSIFYEFEGNEDDGFDTPREAFAALIDKVSGKGTWESNPYVFVYEFKLID
jgi:hypothetical protein